MPVKFSLDAEVCRQSQHWTLTNQLSLEAAEAGPESLTKTNFRFLAGQTRKQLLPDVKKIGLTF